MSQENDGGLVFVAGSRDAVTGWRGGRWVHDDGVRAFEMFTLESVWIDKHRMNFDVHRS